MTASRLFTLSDIQRTARRRLPRMMYDFIEGAAGSETLASYNTTAIDRIRLQPRVLVNIEKRSLHKSFLGRVWQAPFGIAPMGMCNLAWPRTDNMLAAIARDHQIPIGLSTAASTSIEDMRNLAGDCAWFQLYVAQTDELTFSFIDRARQCNYDVLLFTVDVPELSPRIRDQRNGFDAQFKIGVRQFLDFAMHPHWSVATLLEGRPSPVNFEQSTNSSGFVRTASRARVDIDYVKRVRDAWPGKLVIKGVLSPADAVQIQSAGADAVYVSNHGGRQLDSAPAAIHMLGSIRMAVGPDFPLIFDSGVRSGEGILKSLAVGADFVMMGRPFLYAAGAGGVAALERLVTLLCNEIDLGLAQTGCPNVEDIGPRHLVSVNDTAHMP